MPEIVPDASTRPVVRYDAETHARAILQELDGLLLNLQRPAWREATGEAWLTRIAMDMESVRLRLRQPFGVLVVGDFKRGKSTLINALLGCELVTMDVAPETVAVTEVHFGPVVRVEARLVDGGRVELREEDLPSARLGPILENLPGPVDVVRIEAPIPLLEGLTIVDSPGTGDLLWRFDRRVADYLPRADAVLHVVSAISPLSETEREFLRLSLRPLDLAKVVFVVNQIDQIRTTADATRVVERVAESLRPLFPDSAVVAVSALHELARRTEEPLPRPDRAAELDAAFAGLRDLLDRRVLLHRDVVRNERGAQEAEAVLGRACADLTRLQRAMELDRSTLRDALVQAREGGSAARQGVADREAIVLKAIQGMGEQAVLWMDGLVSRIEATAASQLLSIGHEDAQRHFPFFLAEVLRDGLTACVGAHQELVLALVENVSEQAAKSIGREFGADGGDAVGAAAERAGFHTPAWTVFDHMHTLAFLLNGLTMGVSSVFTAFTGALDRSKGQEARAEHFRQRFLAAVPSLREQVAVAVRKAYADLGAQVCERLRTAQEDELSRIEAELGQALAVHDKGVGRIGEATVSLTEVVTRLQDTSRSLAELRQRLRSVSGA